MVLDPSPPPLYSCAMRHSFFHTPPPTHTTSLPHTHTNSWQPRRRHIQILIHQHTRGMCMCLCRGCADQSARIHHDTDTYMSIRVCWCMSIRVCVVVYTYIFLCRGVYVYMSVSWCICIYVCVVVYTHTPTYTCVICTTTVKDASTKHTHTDTRTHTNGCTHEDITKTYTYRYIFERATLEAMQVSYVDIATYIWIWMQIMVCMNSSIYLFTDRWCI